LTLFAIEPTYDDLFAKALIKLAQVLKNHFARLLYARFGQNRVLIAPIKELFRCKAKLNEIKAAQGIYITYYYCGVVDL